MSDYVKRKSGVFGRLLRIGLGVFFVTEVWPVYMAVTLQGILIRLSWAFSLTLFYFFLHLIIARFFNKLHPMPGAILAFTPFLAVFIFGYGSPAATGALTFLAVSLILAAVRADPGCEVMSLPAILSGTHTHLACLLFSPIDWIESNSSNYRK